MEDNKLGKAITQFISNIEKPPGTKATTPARKGIATFLRTQLPVVHVPLNHVKATLEYAFGMATGLGRTAYHLANSADKLTPEIADSIMRQLKRGAVVAALSMYAFWDSYHNQKDRHFGGLYVPRQKKGADEVGFGEFQVGDHKVWGMFMAHPALIAVQFWSTVGMIAGAPRKAKEGDQNPAVAVAAATAASMLYMLESAPVANESEKLSQLMDPASRDYAIGEMAAGYIIPVGVEDIAKMMDLAPDTWTAVRRKPKTIGEHFMMGVPGREDWPYPNRQDVPERR